MLIRVVVSIHAPRAGRDRWRSSGVEARSCFNPRAPCGARLWKVVIMSTIVIVSIHAPRAGRDGDNYRDSKNRIGFNPRAPCGARPPINTSLSDCTSFQSTRPVRGATLSMTELLSILEFQSTRPVRGATANEVTPSLFCHIFMGITRHKYDFLGILSHAPPPAWFAHLYFYTVFSVHFTFALRKNAQMMMADSKS